MSKKQEELTRLCNYAIGLHLSGKVCVFIDMSGHVEWLAITIRKSIKEYDKVLGNWTVSFGKYYDGKNRPPSVIKKHVTNIIKEMQSVVDNYEEALAKEQERTKQLELEKLEELKAKYEVTEVRK